MHPKASLMGPKLRPKIRIVHASIDLQSVLPHVLARSFSDHVEQFSPVLTSISTNPASFQRKDSENCGHE